MQDFLEKTGRISVCVVLSILKTVPVSREFTAIDLFQHGEFVPQGRRPLLRFAFFAEQASNAPGQFH